MKNRARILTLVLLTSAASLLPKTLFADETSGPPSERLLIPEIMALPNGAEIPREIFDQHDARSVGESVVARLETVRGYSRWRLHTEPVSYDLHQVGEVIVNFRESFSEALVQAGRLLNLHQTGHSVGAAVPEERARKENVMIGLQVERRYQPGANNPANRLRPIYGTLNLPAPESYEIRSVGTGDAYGDVVAVARPEVNNRTTVNPGDSLLSPGTVRTLYAKWRYKSEANNGMFSKHEVQIWGGLELADLKEFRVTPFIKPENFEALKKAGLPIYTYKIELVHGRRTVVRDQLVFEGDPQKQLEHERRRRRHVEERPQGKSTTTDVHGGRGQRCGVAGALRRLLRQ